MKRIIFILIAAAMAIATAFAADSGDKPNIVFDKTSHDFGTIKEADGKVSHDFSFTNTGKSPLVIVNAVAGCGCVKVKFPQSPIAPGKKGVITATYNPRGQAGDFFKNINVRTNVPKSKKIKLSVTGCVVPKQ